MNQHGWKWDLTVYDRPGWNSVTYGFPHGGAIQKENSGAIILRFDSADAEGINDDFYLEHYEAVTLRSDDGGRHWRRIEKNWLGTVPVRLSDGTLVGMSDTRSLRTPAENRARLVQRGLGHHWRDDCLLCWELWPRSMADELRAKGHLVWDQEVGPRPDQILLPRGTVATHDPGDLVALRSTDQGKHWERYPVEGVDAYYTHFLPCAAGSVVLPDDTVVVPCYGIRRGEADPGRFTLKGAEVFTLRSSDGGRSFTRVIVGSIPDGSLTESSIVYHPPSGDLITVIRNDEVYVAFSSDGGISWSPPQPTGIRDAYPLHAICLDSGALLCTHAHRVFPGGIRATMSHDAGRTWDVEHEKILRDDVLPSSYIGGTGSVQLDDGSIFTFYNLVKAEKLKDTDQADLEQPLILHPRWHCYIAASRYSEDFGGPLSS